MLNRGNGSLHDEMWIRYRKLYIIVLNGDMRPLLNVPFTCGLQISLVMTPRVNKCLGYTFLVVFSDKDVLDFWNFKLDSAHTSDWNPDVEFFKFNKKRSRL
jgi:hypothetical protein